MNIAVAHPTTEATAGLKGQRALVIGAEYGVGPAVVAALAGAGRSGRAEASICPARSASLRAVIKGYLTVILRTV